MLGKKGRAKHEMLCIGYTQSNMAVASIAEEGENIENTWRGTFGYIVASFLVQMELIKVASFNVPLPF